MEQLNRRSFVQGAGLAAGAAALAVAGTAVADESQAAQPWMPEKWDRETDVVIVGSGSVISAALRAHDAGLDVLVLEKHPTWFGGSTALCGGGIAGGDYYYRLEGRVVCEACLERFARRHFSGERRRAGRKGAESCDAV